MTDTGRHALWGSACPAHRKPCPSDTDLVKRELALRLVGCGCAALAYDIAY